jgi:hypothetical protein
MHDERRESYRLPDVSRATCILLDGDKRYQGTLRDLSMAGFFLETADQPEVAQRYTIEIILEGTHSRLVVDNISGVIARKDRDGVAIEFTQKFEWLILAPIFYHQNKAG